MNAANNDWFRKFCDIVYEKRNLLLTIAIILFVLTSALSQVFPTMHFWPINGAFQNYNVVRRLIDGQIPFKDYVVYLGPLHLYLGAVFTLITGNCFASSVFSYNLLAELSFIVLAIALSKALNFSYSKTCSLILLLFCGALFLAHNDISFIFDFSKLAPYILYTENSARLLRALPLFLGCLFIFLTEKKVHNEKLNNFYWGCVAGFAFLCSNDFGVSTFLALSVTFLLIKVFKKTSIKDIFMQCVLYSIGAMLTLFVSVVLYSQGHIISWFVTTFGQGSDQGWYFIGETEKITNIFHINAKPPIILHIVFTLFILYKLCVSVKNNFIDDKIKYLIIFLLNFTSCIVTQELNFFSDGNSFIPEVIFCITLLFYFIDNIYNRIYDLLKNRISDKTFKSVLNLLLLTIILNCIIFNIFSCFTSTTEPKIHKLGGRLSQLGDDVLEAKNFIKDEKIFSTYASALEVVTNQFQPSGYDYIIHVLGDKSREKYMNTFRKGDFKYVTTQQYSASSNIWENWIVYANWYFYRELYRNYKPVYNTSYLNFYERVRKEDYNTFPKNTKIEIQELSKNCYKISLKTTSSVYGIADLDIDFDINKNLFAKLYVYRTLLKITYPKFIDNYNFNKIYRPDKSYTIGIPIINGYGELIVNSEPLHNVKLNINNVIVGKYYKTPMKYINIVKIINNNYIAIDNFRFNKLMLMNKNKIRINNKVYVIKNKDELATYRREGSDNYIIFELDKPVDSDARILEIIE